MAASSGFDQVEGLAAELLQIREEINFQLAEVLNLMEPKSGKDAEVDAESEKLVEQTDRFETSFSAMSDAIKSLRAASQEQSQAAKAEAEASSPPPDSSEAQEAQEAVHSTAEEKVKAAQRSQGAEDRVAGGDVGELRESLAKVTRREKERVEGLEAQLEMARQELADCRGQRRLEQASLAASESQASQLRAALTCAEDDLRSLRDALDQELVRSHRLQQQVVQLEEENKGMKAHLQRFQEMRGGPAGRGDGIPFDAYMAERRREMEGPDRGRPGSSKGRPVSAGRMRSGPGADGDLDDSVGSMTGGGEYRATGGMEVVVQRQADQLATDALRPSAAIPQGRRPRPASAPLRNSAVGGMGAMGMPSGVANGGYKAPYVGLSASRKVDTTNLSFLRTHVISGHITKSTPLQLSVEYCGRQSFSVRHNEAKYTQLAEQLAAMAFAVFQDRKLTVLKNSEAVPGMESAKQPRLGSFEIELIWVDSNNQPRRTILHSKLQTRSFPKVKTVIEQLSDILDGPVQHDERLQ